ncbi:MAG: hypothetical protein K2X28_07895 [Alphaproteobacteria bacterium]|nr:hypothetical protein [Alphaproteobacteria bacterium]
MDKNREGGRMIDKVTFIENKILALRQKKERLQTQQSLLLMKEAQKILKDEFSLETALTVLKDSWATASKTQKAEWATRAGSFLSSPHKTHQKIKKHNPTPEQNRKAEASHHEHTCKLIHVN